MASDCAHTTSSDQVLLLKLGAPEVFLGQCMEPPSIEQVRSALACLLEVGAVLPLLELPLTALGYHLARMPVDVHVGKMLIYASLLGVSLLLSSCFDSSATLLTVAVTLCTSVWSQC